MVAHVESQRDRVAHRTPCGRRVDLETIASWGQASPLLIEPVPRRFGRVFRRPPERGDGLGSVRTADYGLDVRTPRRDEAERDAPLPRNESGIRERLHTNDECSLARHREELSLLSGEYGGIEVGERISLQCRPEIRDRRVALA